MIAAAETETTETLETVTLARGIPVATMTVTVTVAVTAPTTEILTKITLRKRAVAAAWGFSNASCRAIFGLHMLILRPGSIDCRRKRTVPALTGRRGWCWG